LSRSIDRDDKDILNEGNHAMQTEETTDSSLDTGLRVTSERLSQVPISRFILGNFIESGFGRQTSGMWAEMLYNRSFQEIPPYKRPTWGWLQLDTAYYNENAPFWHSGYEECDWELISPERSQRWHTHGSDTFKGLCSLVVSNDAEGQYAGIKQRGIHFQAGEEVRFSIFGGFAMGWGQKVSPSLAGLDPIDDMALERRTVHIVLKEEGNEQNILFSHSLRFRCLQKQFELDILLPDYTGRAVLEIAFEWEGSLLLSWCSLMPQNNVKGWRADVVELLKKVSPPVIRFPGGCFTSFFDWMDAVGPRGQRAAMESYYWGGLDENDVGVDEYLDLCAQVGAEPQICINMMTSTPFRAAELVEYCNGSDESSMGRFRKENGVTRRKKVIFWEMDNEPSRKWSALQYARQVVEFAVAMRSIDPDIQIMMAYYGFKQDLEWLPQMLEIAGEHIDFVIHRQKSKDFIEKALAIIREYNSRNGTTIRQVNTEWLANLAAPEPFDDPEIPQDYKWQGKIINDYKKVISFRQIHWFYALNAACSLLDYMSLGGEFYLANFNNCVNTWGQNVIESAKEGAWLSPAGYVFRFFGDLDGRYPLRTEFTQGETPLLKAQACETEDEQRVHIYVVNIGRDALSVSVDLPTDYKVDLIQVLFAPDRLSRCHLHTSQVRSEIQQVNNQSPMRIKPLSVNRIICSKHQVVADRSIDLLLSPSQGTAQV
jgi:alpha-L-arabinofuranosidase